MARNQCDQIGQSFVNLEKYKKCLLAIFGMVYLVFDKLLTWAVLYATLKAFFVVNGQSLINNLAIWSHRQKSKPGIDPIKILLRKIYTTLFLSILIG